VLGVIRRVCLLHEELRGGREARVVVEWCSMKSFSNLSAKGYAMNLRPRCPKRRVISGARSCVP
jgi:hypothetical protein